MEEITSVDQLKPGYYFSRQWNSLLYWVGNGQVEQYANSDGDNAGDNVEERYTLINVIGWIQRGKVISISTNQAKMLTSLWSKEK